MSDWTALKKTFVKIRSHPVGAIRIGMAILKGFLVKARYATNPNVKIGSNFRVYAWPRIIGPGKVCISDNVSTHLRFLRRPCILTHTVDAVVIVGKGSSIGGTRISCVNSVTIGEETLLGCSTIIDSDLIPPGHIILDEKWKEEHTLPITIGNYVWTGVNSFILSGTVLGDECVLGAGAVVQYQDVPERSLLVGNPARKVGVTRTV